MDKNSFDLLRDMVTSMLIKGNRNKRMGAIQAEMTKRFPLALNKLKTVNAFDVSNDKVLKSNINYTVMKLEYRNHVVPMLAVSVGKEIDFVFTPTAVFFMEKKGKYANIGCLGNFSGGTIDFTKHSNWGTTSLNEAYQNLAKSVNDEVSYLLKEKETKLELIKRLNGIANMIYNKRNKV